MNDSNSIYNQEIQLSLAYDSFNKKILNKLKTKPKRFKAFRSKLYNVTIQSTDIKSTLNEIANGTSFSYWFSKDKEQCSEDFLGTSFLALDFDNKKDSISPQEVYEKSTDLGLEPCLMYYSLSHCDLIPKFRVLYRLDSKLTNPFSFALMMKCLSFLFPQSDKNALDHARVFYGGKGVVEIDGTPIINDEAFISTVDVLEALGSTSTSNDVNRIWKKLANTDIKWNNHKVKVHLEKSYLNLQNKKSHPFAPIKSDYAEIWGVPLNIYKSTPLLFRTLGADGADLKSSIHHLPTDSQVFIPLSRFDDTYFLQVTYSSESSKRASNNGTSKSTKLKKADKDLKRTISECQLLNWTVNQGGVPNHKEVTHIAYFVRMYVGGSKFFKGVVKRLFSENKALEWIKKYNSFINKHPNIISRCSKSHCRFYSQCTNAVHNHTPQKQPLACTSSPKIEYSTIDESRNYLEKSYEDVLNGKSNHLINADTGVGKTEIIINNLKGDEVFAVLNHEQINEIEERIIKIHKNKFKVYKTSSFNTEELILLGSDEYQEAIECIKTMSYEPMVDYLESLIPTNFNIRKEFSNILGDSHPLNNMSSEVESLFEEIQKYVNEQRSFKQIIKQKNTIILTTQAKVFSFYDFSGRHLILDEDPSEVIFQRGLIPRNLLNPNGLSLQSTEFIRNIMDLGRNQTFLPSQALSYEEQRELRLHLHNSGQSNQKNEFDFCKGTVFFRGTEYDSDKPSNTIAYAYPKRMPKASKITIMSATASFKVLSKLFKGLKHIEVPSTMNYGKLYQCVDESFSKKRMKDKSSKTYGILKEIESQFTENQNVPNAIIISHKEFKANKNIYHGNAIGQDKYNGSNIIILGQLALPSDLDIVKGLLLEPSISKFEMKTDRVNFKGFNSTQFTFEEELLQEIHLHGIWSNLTQTVGRARLNLPKNSNSNVVVFSRQPLMKCTLVTAEDTLGIIQNL